MDANLFADLPFNLAGESQSSELTAEAEARVRALAESEARKAQLLMDPIELIETALAIHARQDEIEGKRRPHEARGSAASNALFRRILNVSRRPLSNPL